MRTAFDGVTLMRTDSICTMLMTKYAIDVIEKDSHFLNKTVGGVTRELVKERSGGGGEEEKKESVLKVAEMYSDAIFGCPEDVPEPLRVIARVLKEEVINIIIIVLFILFSFFIMIAACLSFILTVFF